MFFLPSDTIKKKKIPHRWPHRTGLLLANGDHPVSMMSKHLEKKTSLKPPANIIQLYIYIIIYIEFYAIQSLSPVFWVSRCCTWPVSRTGFPTHGWSLSPVYASIIPDTQRAIIYHCQYILYIYIAMITIIILHSILLILIIANVYYIVYILSFPI